METNPVSSQPTHVSAPGTAKCEICGNMYDNSFRIEIRGVAHTFDCFECAIQCLAPTCAHCGCRVIGHGVEAEGITYCCAHCARTAFPEKKVSMNV